MDNREIARSYVQKGDLILSELTSSGGVLQPQQTREFFRIMIEPAVLLSEIDMPPLKGPTELVDRLGFLNAILRHGNDGQALTVGDRYKPDLSKVTFTAKEVKTQVNLTYSQLEDNIEGNTLESTVQQMMADAARRDLEDLAINGDTASTSNFYATWDGILKQQTSHTVDRNSGSIQTIQLGHFTDMIKAFPREAMLPERNQMRFYGGYQAEIKYRETLAGRLTPGGDTWINTEGLVAPYGIPFKGIPRFPEALGTGSNETNVVLVNPKNISLGVWRQLNWQTFNDVIGGNWLVIGRMRADIKFRYEPFSVKAIHIGY